MKKIDDSSKEIVIEMSFRILLIIYVFTLKKVTEHEQEVGSLIGNGFRPPTGFGTSFGTSGGKAFFRISSDSETEKDPILEDQFRRLDHLGHENEEVNAFMEERHPLMSVVEEEEEGKILD